MQYQGSCHCGRIAFTVQAEAPIKDVIDCNCSICRRRGSLLWVVPGEAFQLDSDIADVATYHFNKRHINHHHCRVCGTAPYSDGVDPGSGKAIVAVNVRCLPEVDLASLSITSYDGAAL